MRECYRSRYDLVGADWLSRPTTRTRILPVPAGCGRGRLTLMSEVKGRDSDLAFRLTAGRFLVIVIGCKWSEMAR